MPQLNVLRLTLLLVTFWAYLCPSVSYAQRIKESVMRETTERFLVNVVVRRDTDAALKDFSGSQVEADIVRVVCETAKISMELEEAMILQFGREVYQQVLGAQKPLTEREVGEMVKEAQITHSTGYSTIFLARNGQHFTVLHFAIVGGQTCLIETEADPMARRRSEQDGKERRFLLRAVKNVLRAHIIDIKAGKFDSIEASQNGFQKRFGEAFRKAQEAIGKGQLDDLAGQPADPVPKPIPPTVSTPATPRGNVAANLPGSAPIDPDTRNPTDQVKGGTVPGEADKRSGDGVIPIKNCYKDTWQSVPDGTSIVRLILERRTTLPRDGDKGGEVTVVRSMQLAIKGYHDNEKVVLYRVEMSPPPEVALDEQGSAYDSFKSPIKLIELIDNDKDFQAEADAIAKRPASESKVVLDNPATKSKVTIVVDESIPGGFRSRKTEFEENHMAVVRNIYTVFVITTDKEGTRHVKTVSDEPKIAELLEKHPVVAIDYVLSDFASKWEGEQKTGMVPAGFDLKKGKIDEYEWTSSAERVHSGGFEKEPPGRFLFELSEPVLSGSVKGRGQLKPADIANGLYQKINLEIETGVWRVFDVKSPETGLLWWGDWRDNSTLQAWDVDVGYPTGLDSGYLRSAKPTYGLPSIKNYIRPTKFRAMVKEEQAKEARQAEDAKKSEEDAEKRQIALAVMKRERPYHKTKEKVETIELFPQPLTPVEASALLGGEVEIHQLTQEAENAGYRYAAKLAYLLNNDHWTEFWRLTEGGHPNFREARLVMHETRELDMQASRNLLEFSDERFWLWGDKIQFRRSSRDENLDPKQRIKMDVPDFKALVAAKKATTRTRDQLNDAKSWLKQAKAEYDERAERLDTIAQKLSDAGINNRIVKGLKNAGSK